MKLHEIKGKSGGRGDKRVTIEPAKGQYGDVKLDVEFSVSKGGSSRHGDNSSYDEDHDDEYTVHSIKLAQDVEEYDDDGQEVVKTWKKGTDADKLPGWTGKDEKAVEEKL